MTDNKQKLKERFERLFPDCTLYAIQLDGFSHSVFYKDVNGNKKIDGYTAYAPEQYSNFEDGVHGWNRDQAKALFIDQPHYCYQHNAQEYCYKPVSEW